MGTISVLIYYGIKRLIKKLAAKQRNTIGIAVGEVFA